MCMPSQSLHTKPSQITEIDTDPTRGKKGENIGNLKIEFEWGPDPPVLLLTCSGKVNKCSSGSVLTTPRGGKPHTGL